MPPAIAISALKDKRSCTSSEKKLLRTTKMISLIQTPVTKLNPPLWPLVKLCLSIVNITGPTDKASIIPKPSPLIMASVNSK